MNRSPQEHERDVGQALTALREEMKSLSAPPRVEAAVIEAFRARKPERRAAPWAWSLAAAVACAAIALAVFGLRPVRPALAPPAVVLRHAPPAPAVRMAQRPAPRRAMVPAVSRPRRSEIATGFFPVRYGAPLDEREFAEIVRVTVPRAVMVRYGLPVWGDLAAPVGADIIVGRDRVAQAIRFVR
jgi:hypothetical protein